MYELPFFEHGDEILAEPIGVRQDFTRLAKVLFLPLLAQNPEAEQRLYAEIDQVLAGRSPTVDDLPRLPYACMVFEEAMRLYPPVWVIMRKALHDDEIGGYRIPAKTYVLWSAYAIHRHRDFWEQLDHFAVGSGAIHHIPIY